jgi:hypothetical protein
MKICQFAESEHQPCANGYSKLIRCQKDGVIRCLKECMSSCGQYLPEDEPQAIIPVRKTSKPVVAAVSGQPTTSRKCCGAVVEHYAVNGVNISYS